MQLPLRTAWAMKDKVADAAIQCTSLETRDAIGLKKTLGSFRDLDVKRASRHSACSTCQKRAKSIHPR